MPQIQILPAAPSFSSQLGEQLGAGLGLGLAGGLNRMLENKKNQRSAESLANQLGLKDESKSSFVGTFGNIPAKDQFSAFEQMMTAQILGQYLQGQQQAPQIPTTSQGVESLEPTDISKPISRAPLPAIGKLAPLAQQEREERKLALKTTESEERAAEPFMQQIRGWAQIIPELNSAIDTSEEAIKSGELSGFGKNFWAEKLNFPQLLSARGKQLKSAVKQFMTQGKDLFGARPTNYDVQILESMLPRIGESKWAGLSAVEMQKFRRDMLEAKVNATQDIRRDLGRTPRDIDLRVEDSIKGIEEARRRELKSKLELYAAMDGTPVDYRYTKQTLLPDEYLILKDKKPIGIAKKEDVEDLKKQGFQIIK